MENNVLNVSHVVDRKFVSMIVKNIGAKSAVEKEYACMHERKDDVRSVKPF
jgi:hypothetical protein